MNNNQISVLGKFSAGFYVWIISVFFGAVLLDSVYYNLINSSGVSGLDKIFSGISDFLLSIGFITLLSAISTILLSWKSAEARNIFIASLLIILVEFTAPRFLSDEFLNSAYILRLIVNGTASILAVIGFAILPRIK